jgi:hypothetical protein
MITVTRRDFGKTAQPLASGRPSARACNCDIETGHRSTSATLITNVAHKTKAYLEWDREAERFTNNADANKLLMYRYREPYKLPLT